MFTRNNSDFVDYLVLNLVLFGLVVGILFLMGRPLYCPCGFVKLWQTKVFSPQISQHLMDWYIFTHLIHGFLLYLLLTWLVPDTTPWARLTVAILIEGSWEIFENTQYMIEYYRNNTMAIEFYGDSIINSAMDMVGMIVGFLIAHRAWVWLSITICVGLEALTIFFIRDSLFLNVIMFIYPFEFIREWQLGMM